MTPERIEQIYTFAKGETLVAIFDPEEIAHLIETLKVATEMVARGDALLVRVSDVLTKTIARIDEYRLLLEMCGPTMWKHGDPVAAQKVAHFLLSADHQPQTDTPGVPA